MNIRDVDPPTFLDLSETQQVQACCVVIEGDRGWLFDCLDERFGHGCLAALRRMDATPLGLELRRCVLDGLRQEVDRRLADGEMQ